MYFKEFITENDLKHTANITKLFNRIIYMKFGNIFYRWKIKYYKIKNTKKI